MFKAASLDVLNIALISGDKLCQRFEGDRFCKCLSMTWVFVRWSKVSIETWNKSR